jgi:hypothetical protein
LTAANVVRRPWVLRTATGDQASTGRKGRPETKTPRSKGDLGAHWGAPEEPGAAKYLWGVQDSDLRLPPCEFAETRYDAFRKVVLDDNM